MGVSSEPKIAFGISKFDLVISGRSHNIKESFCIQMECSLGRVIIRKIHLEFTKMLSGYIYNIFFQKFKFVGQLKNGAEKS